MALLSFSHQIQSDSDREAREPRNNNPWKSHQGIQSHQRYYPQGSRQDLEQHNLLVPRDGKGVLDWRPRERVKTKTAAVIEKPDRGLERRDAEKDQKVAKT